MEVNFNSPQPAYHFLNYNPPIIFAGFFESTAWGKLRTTPMLIVMLNEMLCFYTDWHWSLSSNVIHRPSGREVQWDRLFFSDSLQNFSPETRVIHDFTTKYDRETHPQVLREFFFNKELKKNVAKSGTITVIPLWTVRMPTFAPREYASRIG